MITTLFIAFTAACFIGPIALADWWARYSARCGYSVGVMLLGGLPISAIGFLPLLVWRLL